MTKTSDLLVRALEREGVEIVFGIPGEENLDLLESLRTSSIRLIPTRHEQAAGFMAATLGRLTGNPGVCLSTLGPGATNFVTAAAYAHLGGFPMMMITGQKPVKASKQGRFQIVDIVRLFEPTTKLTRQVNDGNNVPHLVRECFRLARAEKPGPVHLELPEDVASQPVEREPFEPTMVDPTGASMASLDRAASILAEAKRPLVVFASGVNRLRIHGALTEFVQDTGLYFASTQMGKGAVDETSSQCLGTAALSADDYVHCALDRADAVLVVGHDVTEKPPFFMRRPGPSRVIHLADQAAMMDDVYFPDLEVLGCVASNLRELGKRLTLRVECDWDHDYFARVHADIQQHVFSEGASDPRFPPIPQRIVADVRRAVPHDGIVALDNGMYKLWFARNYQAYEPNTLLLDNALATMGAGLPVAMAAKLVHPERKVLAVCGDGGFMMNSQELETALRLKLDLVVLILRDDAYGMIRWKQSGLGFEDFGLRFGNPDFVRYAEAYGARGHRVDGSEPLDAVLGKCFDSPGVHVVEVPVDYSENERVFLEELRRKTCIV